MKAQLIQLAPKLKISSEEVSKLMKVVAKQQIEIDQVKIVVAEDEAVAKVLKNGLIYSYVIKILQ